MSYFYKSGDFSNESKPAYFKKKRGRPCKSCKDNFSNQVKIDKDKIPLDNEVKRKRGRPKRTKNILKLEYQDELSWEDIQAIEKLNTMSVQASARFLLIPIERSTNLFLGMHEHETEIKYNPGKCVCNKAIL